MKHILAPLALLAARATVPKPEPGDSVEGCADGGLYVISIRGTREEPGIGAAGSIIGRKVQEQVKGTKIVALDYPATLADPSYPLSVGNGTRTLTELITNHVKACPNDKIVLMGYSQGAQVSLDTLCGSDETGFTKTTAIGSDKIENHVVAVALFGDPTHIANVTYDKGTSINNGIFPRKNTDKCLKYANIVSSWCDTGDVYCDSGNVTAVHGSYFENYGTDIVKFIVDKAAVNTAATSTTAPTSSVQPSASGSTVSAADNLNIARKCLYVALPLALAALFQLL